MTKGKVEASQTLTSHPLNYCCPFGSSVRHTFPFPFSLARVHSYTQTSGVSTGPGLMDDIVIPYSLTHICYILIVGTCVQALF